MGTMILGALVYIVQMIAQGLMDITAAVMSSMNQAGLSTIENAGWVISATQVTIGIALSIFTLRVAWEGISQYILWNEGTGDTDGGQVWKGLLRVTLFGGASTYLATNIFQVGIWIAGALMASPIGDLSTGINNQFLAALAIPDVIESILFVTVIGFLLVAIACIIIGIQTAVRVAQLSYFIIGGPLMALGQFNADGGVWNNWFRSLIVLSMSEAVQMIGMKGMLWSLTNLSIPLASSSTIIPPQMPGLLVCIGFAVASIAGPHLVKEWSYRTGIGGAIVSGGRTAVQVIVRQAVTK